MAKKKGFYMDKFTQVTPQLVEALVSMFIQDAKEVKIDNKPKFVSFKQKFANKLKDICEFQAIEDLALSRDYFRNFSGILKDTFKLYEWEGSVMDFICECSNIAVTDLALLDMKYMSCVRTVYYPDIPEHVVGIDRLHWVKLSAVNRATLETVEPLLTSLIKLHHHDEDSHDEYLDMYVQGTLKSSVSQACDSVQKFLRELQKLELHDFAIRRIAYTERVIGEIRTKTMELTEQCKMLKLSGPSTVRRIAKSVSPYCGRLGWELGHLNIDLARSGKPHDVTIKVASMV